MIRLYGTSGSGNCYKPVMLMHRLGIDHEWIEVDLLGGGTRTATFLAMNPSGKVPVLEVEPGRFLSESNAMLCFLADGMPWWPNDRWARARVLQWLFFEQYSHEPHIATVRYWIRSLGKQEEWRERIDAARKKGDAALSVMEETLAHGEWLVGGRATIADLALYAYTHVAHEGGYDLQHYPGIRAWLGRVAAHPTHRPMPSLPEVNA